MDKLVTLVGAEPFRNKFDLLCFDLTCLFHTLFNRVRCNYVSMHDAWCMNIMFMHHASKPAPKLKKQKPSIQTQPDHHGPVAFVNLALVLVLVLIFYIHLFCVYPRACFSYFIISCGPVCVCRGCNTNMMHDAAMTYVVRRRRTSALRRAHHVLWWGCFNH